MKRIFITLLGMSLLAGLQAKQWQQSAAPDAPANDLRPLEIGEELPAADMKMKNVSGKEISFNEVKKEKKGLLVMFSCNTCPYVIKSRARTKEMTAFASQNNIGVIIINSNEAQREEQDSYEAMRQYAKEQKYNVPYVMDEGSQMANLFGATRTPEVFLFDAENKLVYHGAMEDNPSSPKESKELYLKNAIERMSAGEMPEPSFTKSVGCTIKRKE